MSDRYKSIILVDNTAELNRAYSLYNKLTHLGKEVLLLAKDDVEIINDRYPVKKFQYYQNLFPSTYSKIMQEAYDLFSVLAEQKVDKDLTFRELTKYKEVSLCDLSAQYIITELLLMLHDFNMLETVLNFERPGEVYIISRVSNLEKIFELICKKREIPFFIQKGADGQTLNLYLHKFLWKFIILAKKLKRLLVNLLFLFTNLIKSKNLNKKYKLLFFASIGRYLASILPVILKYNNEERLVINMFPSSIKKLKEMEIPYMDFYGYRPYGLFNRDARNLLRKIQDVISKNNSFYNNLLYKKIAIGSILGDLFEKLIYEIFPHNMQKIDLIRKIILSHRPEVIVVLSSSIDIVLTAKSLSTPVVAIQSGFAAEFCYFGPIVADTITVNGNYWKEYLLKNYDVIPDKILVAGPTKFDVILDKKFNIKDSNKILNSNDSQKNVVFASAYVDPSLGMFEYERNEQFRNVCRAIKNISEVHLVIKLHPWEKDLRIYKEVIQETGLSNYNVIRNAEMLKLLHNCDLLITTHVSTTIYEAILLDKNVVSLFGSSKFEPEDMWNFKKYGAAMVIDNPGELEKYIRNVLFDSETRTELKKNRKEYIYEHAYKLDGNASGRVKEKIDYFISK